MTEFIITEIEDISDRIIFFLDISGKNIVWNSEKNDDNKILLYDGNKIIDAESNSNIFLYNGNKVIQLTNDNLFHEAPQISGNSIVWSAGYGNDEKELYYNTEIYFHNGKEIIQLTDNNVPDLFPQIDGDRIIWQRVNSENNTVSIMLATIDETESTSKSIRDRHQKMIASSTIVILGLILFCWVKKIAKQF